MTWITLLWPMVTAACMTMGLIHVRIGLRRKRGAPHLLFALTALFFAVYSVLELAMMHASSPAQFLELQRWADFDGTAGVVTLAAFVWVLFGTGRKWLALLGCGLLCGSLILNLLPEPKLVFLQITKIRTVETFGGASYNVAEGTRNPWVFLFYLGILFIAGFVADASITLWRQGGRRRAVRMGGTITFFLLAGGLQVSLVDAGILPTPYLVSFVYLTILAAMGIELSDNVIASSQLADDLQESEQRLNLAADAAHLGLWDWNVETDEVWTTPQGRVLFGLTATERLDRNRFFAAVQLDYCGVMQQSAEDWLQADFVFEQECRLAVPGGGTRWIAVRGEVERDDAGRATRVRGIALDISERKEAEEAARSLSGRLINAQEAERARLARELHDDLSQSLALLAVEMDIFVREPPAAKSVVMNRLEEFSAQVKLLSSGVHRLSHELHPAKLEQLGLVAAVRGFCRELGATHEIEIEIESRDVPRSLPNGIALCLYRVIQEGLQNVVKHSGAKGAKVELWAEDGNICLVVSDQGCGFDVARPTGQGSLGLVSMRERVRLVQGHISVHSSTGNGTRIELRIPLEN